MSTPYSHMSGDEVARLMSLCNETLSQSAEALEREKPDDTESGDLD